MIENILVVTQPQDKQYAIDKAFQIAGTSYAHIHIVINMFEPLWFEVDSASLNETAQADNALPQGVDLFPSHKAADFNLSYEVIYEKYGQHWILEHTQNHHYDLIVYQAIHNSKNFSLTDWELFRKSKYPVYIATGEERQQKRLLLALDILNKSDDKQALNEKILGIGQRLANFIDYQLHACAVVVEPSLIKNMEQTAAGEETYLIDNALLKLQTLVAPYGIDKEQLHIQLGTPHTAIAELANQLDASCLIIGSMGRKGLKGKLFGNTSEKVIQSVHCDLLVINPD